MPDDVEEALADHEQRKASERERLKRHMRNVLTTKEGRQFMWDLLAFTGVYRQSYRSDPHATAFNEGQRSVGLMLVSRIDSACPEALDLMRREAADRNAKPVDDDESST